MKRYFIVEEFFGIRVYDSVLKKEYYFDSKEEDKIKNLLQNEYNYINNRMENHMSAPLKISMNITKKCNLRCKQCFSNSGVIQDVELTTEDLKKLFDDMNKYGTFFICIGGGEPFTRPDLFDILEYGKSKQLAISVVSNGLLINEETIEKLNNCSLDTLWISLDGLKENHENLRGVGTFDKTLHTLDLLKKYYKGKTAIRISINKYNYVECEELIRLAEKCEVDLIRLTPLLDFGRAKEQDLMINQEQYIEFLNTVRNINSTIEVVYPGKPNDNKIWVGQNGFGCHCGKEAVWIDEVGTYSPCIFWGDEYHLGNIKERDYVDLWNDSLITSEIEGNDVCKECYNYKNCRSGCRVRSLYKYGNLNDVDPLCPLKRNKK